MKKPKKEEQKRNKKAWENQILSTNGVPSSLIDNLTEWTQGFILISVNEDGSLSIYQKADNDSVALALLSHTKKYVENSEAVFDAVFQRNFFGEGRDEEGESEQ